MKQSKSYRPISISNLILKGLERIIQWRILKDNIKSLPYQYAFLKGKGTDNALSRVMNRIEKFFFKRKSAVAMFLDIQSAFDTLEFASIEKNMKKAGIENNITRWFTNLLKDRTTIYEYGEASITKYSTKGILQGGILSPLIFNLCIGELLEILGGETFITGFADDISTIESGEDINSCIMKLQKIADIAFKWGHENGLKFNPSKTEVIIFSRKKYKVNDLKKIKIEGVEIDFQNTVKYLGIHFDRKLNWNFHIGEKVRKAKALAITLKGMARMKWGIKPKDALWIYKAMIRPIVSYGSIVWAHNIPNGGMKKLNQLQRMSLIAILGAAPSSPLIGLEAIVNILPLSLFVRELGTKARYRIRDGTDWDGLNYLNTVSGHQSAWDKILSDLNLDEIPEYDPWCRDYAPFNIDINNMSSHPTDLKIYTDGSRRYANSGFGWCITRGDYVDHSEVFKLDGHNSVFQCEMLAIQKAVKFLMENEIFTQVSLFSDSQASLHALNKRQGECTVTVNTIDIIYEFINLGGKISFYWIRGHDDSTGNEYADFLAKSGTELECDPYPLPFPISCVKEEVKNYFWTLAENRYLRNPIGRQTKNFIPTVPNTDFVKVLNFSRGQCSLITQWVLGHNNLRYHYSLMGKSDTSICRLCGEGREEVLHLMWYCPALSYLRHMFFLLDEQLLSRLRFFIFDITVRNLLLPDFVIREEIEQNSDNNTSNDSIEE